MNFYNLKSIITAQKYGIEMKSPTDSFALAGERAAPYIEPTFTKVEFENEKPAVILISAVGATGKSTLANVLSSQTGLPLLDLGKHKPVGADTLTGLLTSAFPVTELSRVFEGIGTGSFGVIIDGIDEGRSKTNERAFEAFLDDVFRLCEHASHTSFVLLGRTQIVEDCWLYLALKGVSTGLITIAPFGLEKAREYIDAFTRGPGSSHPDEYREARDQILDLLGAAFKESSVESDQNFLSFIGYPPVLDAIVTLLLEEKNYHRIIGALKESDANDVEIKLLYRIVEYILSRERDQKVLPNIINPLIEDLSQKSAEIKERVFKADEQCIRLVAHCLGRQISLGQIGEPLLDEKYEAQLLSWLPEHPFITGQQFRNAIFEAVALSNLILSSRPEALGIATDYASKHKSNYHLIYLLHRMAGGATIPISTLPLILSSAQEFRSRTASVEIHVDGPDADDFEDLTSASQLVEIEIEILMGSEGEASKTFIFQSAVDRGAIVRLGQRLSTTYVSLPGEILISNPQELEFTAPLEISAKRIILQSPSLVLRPSSSPPSEKDVILRAETMESTVETILVNGANFVLAVADREGLTYPAIRYVEEKQILLKDPLLKEKYLRLRRILVQFRSHSKGALAKYKHKIEHERVLRNDVGRAILKRLLEDGIIRLDGSFYFLEPEKADLRLGISWLNLRKGQTSAKLEQYLQSVS